MKLLQIVLSAVFTLVFSVEKSSARRLGASSKTCLFGKCAKFSASTSNKNCLGGDTRLYSCSEEGYVPARSITSGDSIRTMTADGPACSEVYFTFRHEGVSPALTIEFESSSNGSDTVDLSPRHLVYVGQSFDTRNAILAQDVRPGDVLISSSSENAKRVLSVTPTEVDLVNVLSFEAALEIEGGVIISAHSYDDVLYSYLFWPIRLMYKALGSRGVDQMLPVLAKVDSHILLPVLSLTTRTPDL
jgi:hypothetical protein